MKSSRNRFFKSTSALVLIVFFFVVIALVRAGDVQLETQLAVKGLANGTLVVTWNVPTVKDSSGNTAAFPVEAYILNYTFVNSWSISTAVSVRVNTTTHHIKEAFLGADYKIELICLSNSASLKCGNLTVSAYPSCPKGWSQQNVQCYFMNPAKMAWSQVQQQCQAMRLSDDSAQTPSSNLEDFNKLVASELQTKNQSQIWIAFEECLLTPADQISTKNCCSSLKPGSDSKSPAMNSNMASCPANQELPSVCGKDMPVVTPIPRNITYASHANNSVLVGWEPCDPKGQGWNLLWRTVTVYDTNLALLQNVSMPNSRLGINLLPLTANAIYNVLIWPHKDGTLLNNTAIGSFYLLPPRSSAETNGGALKYPLTYDVIVLWNGSLCISWTTATAIKVEALPFTADSYQLLYGPSFFDRTMLTKVNLTGTSYVIPSVAANSTYKLYVKCFFGTSVVLCAKTLNYTVGTPTRGRIDGDKYVVYESPPNDPRPWIEAQLHCQRRGGYLASILNADEDKYLASVLDQSKPYWTGGRNCSNNGLATWSDANPWNYTKMDVMLKPSGDECCIQSVFASETSHWSYASCKSNLSFVCKYVLKDLGIIKNLQAITLASTAVKLRWNKSNGLWNVTRYDVVTCILNSTAPCFASATGVSSPVLVTGLQRMTSYRFEVSAFVKVFSDLVRVTVTAVTSPGINVSTNVSADGSIELQWPSESQGGEDTSLVYVIQPMDNSAMNSGSKASYQVVTTSNKTSIQGLELESIYNFTLLIKDNKTGTILDTTVFTVVNRPSCQKSEFQKGLMCYWIGSNSATWDDAARTCLAKNGEMVLVNSPEEGVFLQKLAAEMNSSFWIEGKMAAVIKKDETVAINGSSSDVQPQTEKESVRRTRTAITLCRVVTPDKNATAQHGISTQPCTSLLPVMCERKLSVRVSALTNIVVKNISATFVYLGWDLPKWKPSSYNVTIKASAPTARGKRETSGASGASPGKVTVMDDSVMISDLQPFTEYEVSITPIVKGEDTAAIKGDPQSIRISTLDPNATLPMGALELSAPPRSDENVTLHVVADGHLNTFRLISSISLIVLACISLIIFFVCRMYRFRDCLNHIYFAITLIICHILIVLDVNTSDQINCYAVAVCIHFFFMVSFLFFALECFCHTKTMTNLIPLGFLNRSWQHFVIGWGIPIIIIIISAASIPDEYIIKNKKGHCWLNLEGKAMLASVIPIGIFAGLALIFLLLAICARPKDNYEVDEESYLRYDPMQDIRWMLLFLLGLLISHWSMGMIAIHTEDGTFIIGFIVLTIVLGISILLLRCIGDDEVRLRLKNCCQGTPIEPGENEIGRYLSNHGQGYLKKGGDGGHGCLIVKKSYIFRP